MTTQELDELLGNLKIPTVDTERRSSANLTSNNSEVFFAKILFIFF